MTISDDLIDRLNSEAGAHILTRARARRKRALAHIATFVVTLTEDGSSTWEEVFDQPPTLDQILKRVGGGVFVLGMRTRRQGFTARIRAALAAE